MVKLTRQTDGSFVVDGRNNTSSDPFAMAVHDNLINPGNNIINSKGVQQQTMEWNLSPANAGFYAPVIVNPDGDVFTYGSTHVKNLGCNFFAFEDTLSSQDSDWDYNDLTALFELT